MTTAYNIDCMEYMKGLKHNAFDLAIVDPPYGIGASSKKKYHKNSITKYKQKDWDNNIPSHEYFKELFRVSENQVIFGANYFSHYLPPSKGWIVWDKKQPQGVSFAMAELAFSSIDKSIKMFSCSKALMKNCVSNNGRIGKAKAKIHPTQKPIKLYRWLLKNYAKEGDKILDTHLGSGSSRIAADEMGFEFVGCELDRDYFNDQEKRFQKYKSQTRLFESI